MDVEKISNLIKTKRKEKNMTQEVLACRLNVTEKAISRWETGRGTPDISLLIPLSKELDLNVSELLNGEEKQKEDNIVKVIEYEKESKKMKNKKAFTISIGIYTIFLLLYLLYLKVSYSFNSFHLSYLGHILFNLVLCILIIIANWNLYTHYYDKLKDKKRMKKITYAIILVIYMIMVLNITIFSRQLHMFNCDGFRMLYKYGGLNISPFKTILNYIINYQKYNFSTILVNILGNIIIFMPAQYLFMKVFDNLSIKKYLLIDFIVLIIIEFIQLITNCGVFDIDDIILNILGMSIVYYIVKKVKK
ncbi:MAG: VanZ family protein [Bacilli bacterium]|nr:VanZ family protein [Bacilli bacterium]